MALKKVVKKVKKAISKKQKSSAQVEKVQVQSHSEYDPA